MRTSRYALVTAILSSALIAGCSDQAPKSEDLTKQTETAQFKGMLGDQMKNANIKEKAPPAK